MPPPHTHTYTGNGPQRAAIGRFMPGLRICKKQAPTIKNEKSKLPDRTDAKRNRKRSGEGLFEENCGTLWAPLPSDTVARAMVEVESACAGCYFVDMYKDDKERHDYVEIQIFDRGCWRPEQMSQSKCRWLNEDLSDKPSTLTWHLRHCTPTNRDIRKREFHRRDCLR